MRDFKEYDELLELSKQLQVQPEWLAERTVPEFVFKTYGTQGSEIILLHGLFGHLSNWEKVIPILKDYCRVTALEFPILRGRKSEVSVKALALYVLCFLRFYNFEKCYLCGNSLGGHVALRVALLKPDLIRGLILAGPSGLYENSIDTLPVKPDRQYIRKHMYRVFFDSKHVTDEYVEEIYRIISDKENVKRLLVAAKSAKRDYLFHELPHVQVPTLLVWGKDDEITTLEVGQVFASRLPNPRLVVKECCGHAPMMEAPEWFAEETLKFLRQTQ
ncbi:MAG: alpha/beta hydrolase [Deltaproteobacteria bacterium]|nr:alpha/beta hydrolase [Deltaproteobacteria bacterium]